MTEKMNKKIVDETIHAGDVIGGYQEKEWVVMSYDKKPDRVHLRERYKAWEWKAESLSYLEGAEAFYIERGPVAVQVPVVSTCEVCKWHNGAHSMDCKRPLTDQDIRDLVFHRGLTLENLIEWVVKENDFVGLGLITLGDNLRDHVYRILEKRRS